MDIIRDLERLCAVPGPSGFEGEVVQTAREMMAPFMDETWADHYGNALGVRKSGKKDARKVLLAAHLDEIGLIVTGIRDGFLQVKPIGGVDHRILPGRELTVLGKKRFPGIVSAAPPHLLSDEEMEKVIPFEDLYVDIGMTQEEAEENAPVGTPLVYRRQFRRIGDKMICGTAMDDRSCFIACLRALELLRDKSPDCDLYLMGSTGEEIPSMGVECGGYILRPDYCIVVDVTFAREPQKSGDLHTYLGKGPEIAIGSNMTRHVTRHVLRLAEKRGIPFQKKAYPGYTATDAWRIQTAAGGCEISLFSLPLRYMHTPVECLCVDDIENLGRLIAAAVEEPCGEVFSC